MKIDPKLKIRTVVGEAVVLLPGKDAKDMTKVLALNPTSQFQEAHSLTMSIISMVHPQTAWTQYFEFYFLVCK